jgi:hypothetical protein
MFPLRGAEFSPAPANTLFNGVAAVTTAAPAILPIIFLLFILFVNFSIKIVIYYLITPDKYSYSFFYLIPIGSAAFNIPLFCLETHINH